MRYTVFHTIMRRSILLLTLGILLTFLVVAVMSVYLFHDVDREMIGHLNEAFAGLCVEGILFTLIISAPVWLLTFLGRHLFHLTGYSPRARLGFLLGIGITAFQYPWELLARVVLPKLVDAALSSYLVISIILCTIVLLRDNLRQKRLFGALKVTSVQSSG